MSFQELNFLKSKGPNMTGLGVFPNTLYMYVHIAFEKGKIRREDTVMDPVIWHPGYFLNPFCSRSDESRQVHNCSSVIPSYRTWPPHFLVVVPFQRTPAGMYGDISTQLAHVSLPLKHLLLSLHPDFSLLDWVG